MYVAALTVELHLPEARSLKDKRSILKSMLEGSRRRFGVAVAEVEHQDRHQRADIGIASVSASPRQAQEVLDAVERFIWSFPEVEVLRSDRSCMETETA